MIEITKCPLILILNKIVTVLQYMKNGTLCDVYCEVPWILYYVTVLDTYERLWRWLPHRLSKRQLLTTVLLRTPITQMIFFNQGMLLLGSHHILQAKRRNKINFITCRKWIILQVLAWLMDQTMLQLSELKLPKGHLLQPTSQEGISVDTCGSSLQRLLEYHIENCSTSV